MVNSQVNLYIYIYIYHVHGQWEKIIYLKITFECTPSLPSDNIRKVCIERVNYVIASFALINFDLMMFYENL